MVSFMQMPPSQGKRIAGSATHEYGRRWMAALAAVTVDDEIEDPEIKEGEFQIKVRSVMVNVCMFRSSWSRVQQQYSIHFCSVYLLMVEW